MKKFVSLLAMLTLFVSLGLNQTVSAQAKKTKAETIQAAGKTKKDGTPDLRYKSNKATAKPAGPTKKDGTPDMRYKNNKAKKS